MSGQTSNTVIEYDELNHNMVQKYLFRYNRLFELYSC
jgi:hypothetical protein